MAPRRAATPLPAAIAQHWLVAAPEPRDRPAFLCRGDRTRYGVTLEPSSAVRFDSLEAAEAAHAAWCEEQRNAHHGRGDWQVIKATVRTYFSWPREP